MFVNSPEGRKPVFRRRGAEQGLAAWVTARMEAGAPGKVLRFCVAWLPDGAPTLGKVWILGWHSRKVRLSGCNPHSGTHNPCTGS